MNLKTGSKQLESLQELLLLGVWAGRMVQRMSEDSKGLSRKEELELLLALERVRHSVEGHRRQHKGHCLGPSRQPQTCQKVRRSPAPRTQRRLSSGYRPGGALSGDRASSCFSF